MGGETVPLEFPGSTGARLAGVLHKPEGRARGSILMAHCFTCSKELHTMTRLANGLSAAGYAVLLLEAAPGTRFPAHHHHDAEECYVLSGSLCGFAGALLANETEFVSPNVMHWSRSGELIVMVVLGGLGSIYGAFLGAVAYMLLAHFLADLTKHWHLIMGPLLICVVLYSRGGLSGPRLLAPTRQFVAAPREILPRLEQLRRHHGERPVEAVGVGVRGERLAGEIRLDAQPHEDDPLRIDLCPDLVADDAHLLAAVGAPGRHRLDVDRLAREIGQGERLAGPGVPNDQAQRPVHAALRRKTLRRVTAIPSIDRKSAATRHRPLVNPLDDRRMNGHCLEMPPAATSSGSVIMHSPEDHVQVSSPRNFPDSTGLQVWDFADSNVFYVMQTLKPRSEADAWRL